MHIRIQGYVHLSAAMAHDPSWPILDPSWPILAWTAMAGAGAVFQQRITPFLNYIPVLARTVPLMPVVLQPLQFDGEASTVLAQTLVEEQSAMAAAIAEVCCEHTQQFFTELLWSS
eukprot:SAG11_NODE_13180_length_666_cov_1.462081_1_plen_116_part_00